jgi:hypothetical protein
MQYHSFPANNTTVLPTEIRSGRTEHLILGREAVPIFDSTALTELTKLNKSGYGLSHVTEGRFISHTSKWSRDSCGVQDKDKINSPWQEQRSVWQCILLL